MYTRLTNHLIETSSVHQLINRSDASWVDVQQRCATNPAEVSLLDARGRTCLHAACAKRAPLFVIETVLDLVGKGSCLAVDKYRKTPLALAVTCGASISVIQSLLKFAPEAAETAGVLGKLPLHLACENFEESRFEQVKVLVRANPSAGNCEAEDGKTPLHMAIESRYPPEIVRELIRASPGAVRNKTCGHIPLFAALRYHADASIVSQLVDSYPESTRIRDYHGFYPLFRAIEERRASISTLEYLSERREVVLDADSGGCTVLHLELSSRAARQAVVALLVGRVPEIAVRRSNYGDTPLSLALRSWQEVTSRPGEVAARVVEQSWLCLSHVMKATHYQKFGSDSDGLLTLHAAVGCGMPRDVILYCFGRYSSQATQRDASGNLAIHAALNPPGFSHVLDISCIDTYYDVKQTTVLQLLHLIEGDSDTATDVDDARGRSVLTLAACGRSLTPRVFRELVRISDLSRRDRMTGLLPFQSAALPKKTVLPRLKYAGITRQWWEREDRLQLGAIFELLRLAPEMVGATGSVSD